MPMTSTVVEMGNTYANYVEMINALLLLKVINFKTLLTLLNKCHIHFRLMHMYMVS